MLLVDTMPHLTHEELQTLLVVAFTAAVQGNERRSLMSILDIMEQRTALEAGVLHVVVDEEEFTLSARPVREEVTALLRAIHHEGNPYLQTAMSKEKRVGLKAGETFLAVPLVRKGKAIGALSFCVRGIAHRDALKHQILFLESFAELLSTTLIDRMIRQHLLQSLKEENAQLRQSLRALEEGGRTDSMVGNSRAMRKVYREIAQVAPSETTALIRGETGTGKELVARAIHDKSSRQSATFVAINCAALPESLLESELFGYEKGAFTGALQAKKGSFEQAHGGTLFLDEIGEMSLNAQSRLLRVLQEKEVQPVGGHLPRKVDVRLLCATNKDLEQAVEAGHFRADLYYRINVFPLELPPLRERIEDISLLTGLFVAKYGESTGVELVDGEALRLLSEYQWPGNVRELENVVQRAVLVAVGHRAITVEHLPHLLVRSVTSGTQLFLGGESFEQQVGRFEREILEDSLVEAKGNQAKCAELLKTSKRIVQYKIKKYGIEYRKYRP